MRNLNLLKGPRNPAERGALSLGNLSPQAKRLVIIGVIGLVLVTGAYVYTTYFTEPPPPPPPPLALRQVTPKPPPATPPTVKLPETKPEEVKPLTPPPPDVPPVEEQTVTEPPEGEETPAIARRPAERPQVEAKPTEAPKATAKSVQAPLPEKKPVPPQTAKVEGPKGKGGGRYTIQVASLVMERNALSLKERLEKLGYNPTIRKTTVPITRHWVRVGEFTSREEVEGTARRLNVDGFPSNIVDLGQGKFTLEIGSAFNLNEAIDLAHNLQKKNYASKIVSKSTPTPVHQVQVGEYGDRAEALQVIEELKGQGFAPILVRQ